MPDPQATINFFPCTVSRSETISKPSRWGARRVTVRSSRCVPPECRNPAFSARSSGSAFTSQSSGEQRCTDDARAERAPRAACRQVRGGRAGASAPPRPPAGCACRCSRARRASSSSPPRQKAKHADAAIADWSGPPPTPSRRRTPARVTCCDGSTPRRPAWPSPLPWLTKRGRHWRGRHAARASAPGPAASLRAPCVAQP